MPSEAEELFVVGDASGSMAEAAKPIIVRQVMSAAHECRRLGSPGVTFRAVRCFAWGEKLTPLLAAPEPENVPLLQPAGTTRMAALLDWLTAQALLQPPPRVLLLTDGNWSRPDGKRFEGWRRATPTLPLRIVAVGADANLSFLEKLAPAAALFLAEDTASALIDWPAAAFRNLAP